MSADFLYIWSLIDRSWNISVVAKNNWKSDLWVRLYMSTSVKKCSVSVSLSAKHWIFLDAVLSVITPCLGVELNEPFPYQCETARRSTRYCPARTRPSASLSLPRRRSRPESSRSSPPPPGCQRTPHRPRWLSRWRSWPSGWRRPGGRPCRRHFQNFHI